jgi:hypothetical protein
MLQSKTGRKCRLCQQNDETIDNIISACPLLAKEQYIERQECVLKYTLTYARSKGKIVDNEHWYVLILKSVERSHESKVTILWTQQEKSDKTIPNNKWDILIRDNDKRTCVLIEFPNSGDRNVIKKQAEKMLK